MPVSHQLISYIAPGAPATRRPALEKLPFFRPEIGFTPKWYRAALGIDFGEKWHTDPAYRRQTRIEMTQELNKRFPGEHIGQPDASTVDILTGTFGACTIAAIYGVPIHYDAEQWPTSEHQYFGEDELDKLFPPDLDRNDFFQAFLDQVNRIGRTEEKIAGYMNWQGVLNNAQRLRGQDLFMDMYLAPERTKHLLDCVCTTMIDAAKRLQQKQQQYSDELSFFTVSNCLVNMVEPELYEEFLLPLDQRIAESFDVIGIHNCAWTADLYLDHYAKVPGVAYLDMGIDSDLEKSRKLFPETRRAIMYTPMDLANKSPEAIKSDLEQIAENYGPCDLVVADIEEETPDYKVKDLIKLCNGISEKYRELTI